MGNLIKIDTTYKITYSKSGILQNAEFRYSQGKLITHSFRPNWQPADDSKIIDNLNNIEDILEVIKEYAYNNQAEITAINGLPTFFIESGLKDDISEFDKQLDLIINREINNFFNQYMLPIIERNSWIMTSSWIGVPVLGKMVDGELENIERDNKDLKLFNYLCQRILRSIGVKYDQKCSFSDIYKYLDVELTKHSQ